MHVITAPEALANPTTAVESAFNNMALYRSVGRVVVEGRVYVTMQAASLLLGVSINDCQQLKERDRWQRKPCPYSRPGNFMSGVFLRSDVAKSAWQQPITD